jgi:hypothetical protein
MADTVDDEGTEMVYLGKPPKLTSTTSPIHKDTRSDEDSSLDDVLDSDESLFGVGVDAVPGPGPKAGTGKSSASLDTTTTEDSKKEGFLKTLFNATIKMASNFFTYDILKSIFILFFLILFIVFAVKFSNAEENYKQAKRACNNQTSGTQGGVITKTVMDRQVVNDSIVQTTKLNNSYMILYDNKNVDYRHSYYANLNITTMQSWQPYLTKLYLFFLGIYALALLIFQRNSSWFSKIKSFLLVAFLTNVYVLKFFISVFIVCYTWLKLNLPKLFFY